MLQRDRQRQRERGTFSGGGAGALTAEYLVVAGGGGGGNGTRGGGGGAGGYRSSVTGESSGGGASAEAALSISLGTSYTVTVGSGGASQANGSDSSLSSIVSTGGGRGGNFGGNDSGSVGGSGGGAGVTNPGFPNIVSGSSGITGQGFAGGDSETDSASFGAAGGGGGVGENGTNGSKFIAGDGGDGISSAISGTSAFRAGGGGGSHDAIASGVGGAGGGGNAGSNGTINTGGGGGDGAAGGSGVVIIRVPSSVVAEFSAGVVYNYIPQDDFNVYEITAAGAIDTVTFSQGAVTTVGESLRFNDNDSAYLSRTPASAGDRTTWTWSSWVKRANISTGSQALLGYYGSSTNNHAIYFLASDALYFKLKIGGTNYIVTTTSVFRDSSSWYHIVCVFDSTQAVSSDRVKFFVNGVLQPVTITLAPPLNVDGYINSTVAQYIGDLVGDSLDGYLSDVYLIDGEALDPSRFGKQDADGIWQPISYTGTYGTNGFHLDFADNSTAAALGTDTSGNGNNWTPSGITTDDQVSDTPTVNYATLNPLDSDINNLSDGNLRYSTSQTGSRTGCGTIGASSGKFYWEVLSVGGSENIIGVIDTTYSGRNSTIGYQYTSGSVFYYKTGQKSIDSSFSLYGASYTTNDLIGIALDLDSGTVTFYKNNVSQGSITLPSTGTGNWKPAFSSGTSTANQVYRLNFGQLGFTYTPPAGFQALNSANLPAPVIADGKEHFQPALYTGNGTTQAVQGLEFQPDFVWIKNRSAADNHKLLDAVRGATEELESNTTGAEATNSDGLTAFNSNGFTVGADLEYNTSGENFVAWNWNAGGSTVTNTDGDITSQARANTTAGFSIVSYTGTATDSTVGHGLSQAPELIIFKNRDATYGWTTYSAEIGATKYLLLNTTAAAATYNHFQDTAPTSSVFYLEGTSAASVNGSGNNHIAYCFHSVDGFSKFGSYTGNGSADGPFVYTGFRPAFVMIKRTDSTGSWRMLDTKRDTYNLVGENLFANLSDAEVTADVTDFTSNGFKVRNTAVSINASGGTYIYAAFAENPFKTSRAR